MMGRHLEWMSRVKQIASTLNYLKTLKRYKLSKMIVNNLHGNLTSGFVKSKHLRCLTGFFR